MTADIADRLLRRREVERRTGLGCTTIYRRMKAGTFPPSIRLSESCIRWSEREIEEWIAALPKGS
jgi:prophage regulatory protein